MVRIDDRLIHGQVVTLWVRQVNANEIWVVDDAVAADSFTQSLLQMVCPKDVTLSVLSVTAAGQALPQAQASMTRRILALVKRPSVVLRLVELGLSVSEINIGGMGAGPGRKGLYRSVSVSSDDVTDLKLLIGRGVRVYIQGIPTDPVFDVAKALASW